MRIDIWSDVVCPWCYLGSRRLNAAIELVGADDIEVRWHAFQLDPGAPPEPGELRTRLEAKYGDGAFDSMTRRLGALGEAAGIDYRFDLARSINTLDAHRLITWAGVDPSAQGRLVERCFEGYFTRGEDLSSHEDLSAAAAEAGLDREAAELVLAGESFTDEVRADQEMAVELGVTGVPAFVIDHQFLVPGAQDVDRLAQLIEKVRERSGAAG
jgi:predicted DsbA family dithiol-disulfide isomerase